MKPSTTADIIIGRDVDKGDHYACRLIASCEEIKTNHCLKKKSHRRKYSPQCRRSGQSSRSPRPDAIGSPTIAVPRNCGCSVGFLPGLATRTLSAPPLLRTDTKRLQECFSLIAGTARTMPHTLRAVDQEEETISAFRVLAGFASDIAKDATRTKNCLRSVLPRITRHSRASSLAILSRARWCCPTHPLRRTTDTGNPATPRWNWSCHNGWKTSKRLNLSQTPSPDKSRRCSTTILLAQSLVATGFPGESKSPSTSCCPSATSRTSRTPDTSPALSE